MKSKILAMGLLLFCATAMTAREYQVKSPNGRLQVSILADDGLRYSVSYNGQTLITPSSIGLRLDVGSKTVEAQKVSKQKVTSHRGTIQAVIYKKDNIEDNYEQMVLSLNDGLSLIVRAYDEGAAYRFTSSQKRDYTVQSEQAAFNFAKDWQTYVPYNNCSGTIEQQYATSFENTYTHTALSKLDREHLAFTPIIVEADNGVKVVLAESDLENYPGMFVRNVSGGTGVEGQWAPYPKKVEQGGHNKLELLVKSRENYLTKCKKGYTAFPWRIVNVSSQDKDLLNNDMVYRLASPNRIGETSWIRPGKVAWEWWNDWGVYGVPFKSGINNETYKYYIDFASKYGIEYVILDEGWAVNLQADLFQVVPEINLKELVEYGKERGVGLILWAGWYAFERDMEHVCKHYSEMGVKGFKIDFMNRDDALMVKELYQAAAMAAKYKMVIDYHGMYKPTGMNRTFPNVLNFEGVAGLEQNKWSDIKRYDQVSYDVVLPFARMLAGQMDYTQGAMLNGTKQSYHKSNSEPMSQGTRVHQLAEYAVFLSPLNMLCDSPTHYLQNPECTDFIAKFPVTWDETIPLDSKIGQYVAVARRNGNDWYVGVINNWDERDLTLDLSALKIGGKQALSFSDGLNANRIASDYRRETIQVPQDGKLKVHLANGGGFVMKISN